MTPLSLKMAAHNCFQFSTIQISVTFLFFIQFEPGLQQIAWFYGFLPPPLNTYVIITITSFGGLICIKLGIHF